MQKTTCPTCGDETSHDGACSACAHLNGNGAIARPTPPPEVANWVIERPTPEMLEEARRTFDKADYLAALREVEQGGGHRFEDFIDDIERITNGGE